jgi:site-specific DNA-methyltransferase (adenine-specific)
VAANVLQHGTGGINVDGCRVGTDDTYTASGMKSLGVMHDDNWQPKKIVQQMHAQGRWPANLIHDGSDEVVGLFPETAPAKMADRGKGIDGATFRHASGAESGIRGHDDSGGSASRFFYCAKADASERRQSKHPTIKPVALMRYLVRLVTPPGGLVLDPFGGSGTTAEAARLEHCRFLLMELNPEYCADAAERLRQGVLF